MKIKSIAFKLGIVFVASSSMFFLLKIYQYEFINNKARNTKIIDQSHLNREKGSSLETVKNAVIPLDIYMTWSTKELPPGMQKSVDLLKTHNPEFKVHIYDDEECRDFIEENFSQEVLEAYDKLVPGALKADLWRYCVLYINGGIYLDIKFEPVSDMKLISLVDDEYFVADHHDHWLDENKNLVKYRGIYNGLMICKPNNPILLEAINQIVLNVKSNYYGLTPVYPTGPGLLESCINTPEDIKKVKLTYRVTFLPSEREDGIYYGHKMLFKIYPTYRQEQSKFQKNQHYGLLWNHRMIYQDDFEEKQAISNKAFEDTLELLKSSEFSAAFTSFHQFINNYSYSDKIPDAYYWIADLLVMTHQNEQAINIYHHLINNYPSYSKSIEAACKIALINYKYNPELIGAQDELANLLKIYTVYDENGLIELGRHGSLHDGGYVIPLKALKVADALIGYGIDTDNSFEDLFSLNYEKPSYGFDCGITPIKGKSDLFYFVDECIGNDNFLYHHENSNKKITTFNTQIENLKLQNKKVFIKMDIEGAEYDAFPEIIQQSANITGIALEIHCQDLPAMKKAVSLLKDLDQDFLLVHVHGNNYCPKCFNSCNAKGAIPNVIELSFINKSLVKNYHLSKNQSHPTSLDNPNMKQKADSAFEILV